MSKRKRSTYSSYSSSYYKREQQRRIPSPLPYLLVALLAGAGLGYLHFFVYRSLQGKVTNAYTGAAMPGVLLAVSSQPRLDATPEPASPAAPPAQVVTATTSPDGVYNFPKLPPDPVLSVAVDGFSPQTLTVSQKLNLDLKLVPNVLRGRVLTPDDKPVPGAVVWAGSQYTQTQPDGTYTLRDLPAERKLVVKAPGYLAASAQVGQVDTQDFKLQPFVARAIYINADTAATPGKLGALLGLVDATELSAVVIDVKADNTGLVLYDSKLPGVQQMGVSEQIIPDLDGLLAELKKRNIYSIARVSVFWDQALTSAKPDWALKSKKAPGQVWADAYGKHWSNPYMQEVWDYNIDIAKEVGARGFDEVLFDNAQFPSDGELDDIDYGPAQGDRKRVDAIAGFLDRAFRTLSPMGVYLSYNAFGLTPWVDNDMGIGQHFEDIAAHVDYICPDIYPSNFGDGFMGFPKPAEHPGELVAATMKQALPRVVGTPAKIRPWLQDFSGKVKYDTPQVRAEMDAAEQGGAVGWMLWNFNNTYSEGALKRP